MACESPFLTCGFWIEVYPERPKFKTTTRNHMKSCEITRCHPGDLGIKKQAVQCTFGEHLRAKTLIIEYVQSRGKYWVQCEMLPHTCEILNCSIKTIGFNFTSFTNTLRNGTLWIIELLNYWCLPSHEQRNEMKCINIPCLQTKHIEIHAAFAVECLPRAPNQTI